MILNLKHETVFKNESLELDFNKGTKHDLKLKLLINNKEGIFGINNDMVPQG